MKAIGIFDSGFRLYADSASHRTNQPVFLPDSPSGWTALICPAIRISRLGTHISPKFARRYYDSIAAACIFVPSDKADTPLELEERYFAMDSAFATGLWTQIDDYDAEFTFTCGASAMKFSLGSFDIDTTLCNLSQFMTLKMGDMLLFAAYPFKTALTPDMRLQADINGHIPGIDIKIK